MSGASKPYLKSSELFNKACEAVAELRKIGAHFHDDPVYKEAQRATRAWAEAERIKYLKAAHLISEII